MKRVFCTFLLIKKQLEEGVGRNKLFFLWAKAKDNLKGDRLQRRKIGGTTSAMQPARVTRDAVGGGF